MIKFAMSERPKVGSVEYFIYLGLTPEEAEGIARNWAFKVPREPSAYMAHIRRGVEWEREMRSLDTLKHEGVISDQEYLKRAQEVDERYQ